MPPGLSGGCYATPLPVSPSGGLLTACGISSLEFPRYRDIGSIARMRRLIWKILDDWSLKIDASISPQTERERERKR